MNSPSSEIKVGESEAKARRIPKGSHERRTLIVAIVIALMMFGLVNSPEHASQYDGDEVEEPSLDENQDFPSPDPSTNGIGEDEPEGVPSPFGDFSLEIWPSGVIPYQEGPEKVIIETDEYNLTVDWSESSWVDYRIEPAFTNDTIRYRRANTTQPIKGTIDEFGNPLNDVDMTISSWGLQGYVAWFVESCQEFSLNHTFTFFRDYIELNVTYSPGTKNVLTTYFIALFSESGNTYDMFDGGYHRYMPGSREDLPKTHGMGGWYPSYTMYAPAMDMRVPYGNMGVEWGYDETIAYLYSPIWMPDIKGGPSAFSVKYTSLNSVVPNIGLGTPETFHMFIRPYQYNDGKDKGYDVGYAQWVAKKIVDEWGYHDTPMFPLTVMNYGTWSTEFKSWVESSQVKLTTYAQAPGQINYNYGSAWQRNRDPGDDPSLIPDEWEFWGPGDQPQFAGDGDVILNPVSGTYKDVGSFRHHLIEDNPYNNWWWGSDAVFWDEINTFTPDVKPRNDYHNWSEYVYDGYLKLVQETYESGHWEFVIANPYTALLHLSFVSDLTVIESYRPSSFFGANFMGHTNSTMKFVNNIPTEYRPNILVYQYYNADNHPADQEDVYKCLLGSAEHRFHVALVSWSDQSKQVHNMEMAEKMYLAMGASRDGDIQVQAGTIDLDEEGYLSTDSRVIVWAGNEFAPSIRLTSHEPSYNFTNLRSESTSFMVSISTDNYYLPGSPSVDGKMTYFPDGSARFNGNIESEETGDILRLDSFHTSHQQSGEATIELHKLTKTEADFRLLSTSGVTAFTISNLVPQAEYAIFLNGVKNDTVTANVSGHIAFTVNPNGDQLVQVVLDIGAPITDLTVGVPHYPIDGSIYTTSSTPLTLTAYSSNGTEIDYTNYRTWNSGQWSNWMTYSNPFYVPGDDGQTFIEYYSVDKDGVVESARNSTFLLDNSAPMSSVSIGLPNHGSVPLYIGEVTDITLDSVDSGSGVLASWVRIEGWPTWSYSNPFNLSSYHGMHLLEFGSIDHVGNNVSAGEIWLYVDSDPPTSLIQVGEPRGLHNGTIYVDSSTDFSIMVNDEGSGVNQSWYKIDETDWSLYAGKFTISGEGYHKVHCNSTDNVSNPGDMVTIDVFVDNTPPVANAGPNLEVEKGIHFTLDGSLSTDNALIVNYSWSLNGLAYYDVRPSLALNDIGSHVLVLTARDIIGMENTDTIWVNVSDTTPPSSPHDVKAQTGDRGEIELTWNRSQDDDTIGYIVYRSSSAKGPFVKITGDIIPLLRFEDVGLRDDSTYYYVVTAVDASGNECPFAVSVSATTIAHHTDGFQLWHSMFMVVIVVMVAVTFAYILVFRRKTERREEDSGEEEQ